MKRKKFLALTLAAAMSLALFSGCSRPSASSGGNDNPSANNTGSTSSEEPIVIKIGHTDSDTRSTHKWSVWLGEWLEEQAPGRFKVEVYPNGQLGDSPDMVAGVKLGTLTMEFDLSSVVSSVSGPATSAVDLPYLYPTYEDWVQGTFENGGLELFNETLAPSGYYCVGMFYRMLLMEGLVHFLQGFLIAAGRVEVAVGDGHRLLSRLLSGFISRGRRWAFGRSTGRAA